MVIAPSFEIKQPPDLKSSRNPNALVSAKLNQTLLDGKLHNLTGFAFAAHVVNTGDKFTKRPGSLQGSCFHGLKSKSEAASTSWGVYPIASFWLLRFSAGHENLSKQIPRHVLHFRGAGFGVDTGLFPSVHLH
jgi:hypothetical protein